MIPEANKPNMIEGPIILGHPDRGARHFVCGELVYSGRYIEIKFGGCCSWKLRVSVYGVTNNNYLYRWARYLY